MNTPATLGLTAGPNNIAAMKWRNLSSPRRERRPASFLTPAEPTRDRVRLWSHFGSNLTARFAAIRDTVAELPIDRVLVDGEAVVLRGDGCCDFGALLDRRAAHEACLVAFDLLQIEGEDLRPSPLVGRQTRLEALLDRERAGIMLSQTIATICRQCSDMPRNSASKASSKRIDKARPPGRTKHWLKIKSAQYRR